MAPAAAGLQPPGSPTNVPREQEWVSGPEDGRGRQKRQRKNKTKKRGCAVALSAHAQDVLRSFRPLRTNLHTHTKINGVSLRVNTEQKHTQNLCRVCIIKHEEFIPKTFISIYGLLIINYV